MAHGRADGDAEGGAPKVVLLSLWRDDTARHLEARVAHLLGKTYPALRWLWVVGDSADGTEDALRAVAEAETERDITVLRHDTGITADDPANRVARLAQTANAGLEAVRETDAWVLAHESDLISPPDVAERLLAPGKDVCGGAVWLPVNDPPLFYDIWAYRKDGRMFANHPPYHPAYRADRPFEVDSLGSVYLFPAADVRDGLRYGPLAVVDLMAGLRARGRAVWCIPTVRIVQPADLWVAREHA